MTADLTRRGKKVRLKPDKGMPVCKNDERSNNNTTFATLENHNLTKFTDMLKQGVKRTARGPKPARHRVHSGPLDKFWIQKKAHFMLMMFCKIIWRFFWYTCTSLHEKRGNSVMIVLVRHPWFKEPSCAKVHRCQVGFVTSLHLN